MLIKRNIQNGGRWDSKVIDMIIRNDAGNDYSKCCKIELFKYSVS